MAGKKKKRPTLKTIASMTGLAVTTVSKALKDAPDIKTSTRERVKLIAEQIGYQPDRTGLRLRTGKTNVISLVLNTEEEVTSMTSQFIIGITRALKETPYNLILTPYSATDDPMDPVRHVVETRAADGVILSRIEAHDRRVAYLHQAGLPFATHGRSNVGIDHAYFDFDSTTFGKDAVQLLAERGCTRVSMIAPPMHLAYAQFMHDGYYQGLQQTGIESRPVTTVTIEDSLESIAEHIYTLAQQENRPDGFVCGSVGATIGVVGGVERAGLVVGQDVNIVSKQPPTNLLKWFGRPIYSIEDDFAAAGFGLATSLTHIIDGAAVEDHQTVWYPERRGQIVTDVEAKFI